MVPGWHDPLRTRWPSHRNLKDIPMPIYESALFIASRREFVVAAVCIGAGSEAEGAVGREVVPAVNRQVEDRTALRSCAIPRLVITRSILWGLAVAVKREKGVPKIGDTRRSPRPRMYFR